MQSLQLVAKRRLEARDIAPPPDPGPGELLVRIRSVGVCGSDMHWYLEGCIGANLAVYPQILGHEPAGEVAAIGAGVTAFQPGDRVSIEPTLSCGHCEYCLLGQHNNCVRNTFMGGPQAQGLFREYALVPQHNAVKFPGEFSFAKATLIEPLAVIMHMLELVSIRPPDTVAVLGAGPMGMLAASVARACGASQVLVADKLPHRLALARGMGATFAADIAQFPAAVGDLTGGRGVDIAIDAAGMAQTINTALAVLRMGGTLVQIGIPIEATLPIHVHAAMAKELRIQTLKRSNHRSAPAIALLASGAVGDSLITHRVPLADTPAAFETLADYRDGVGKIVVEMPA